MGVDLSLTGHPKFDQLEIVKTGVATVSSDGSATSWATVPHNLGFRPIIMAYLDDVGLTGIFSAGNIPLPTFTSLFVDTVEQVVENKTWVFAAADDTNAYVVMYNSTGSATSTFAVRYYLLRSRSS